MIRFNEMRRERVFEIVGNYNAIVLQQEKLHRMFFNQFNVGLLLLICIHSFLLLLWMSIKSLACASARGRQTHRPENAHPVKGSISLASVSPTPLLVIYKTFLNALFLHDFNVVTSCDYAMEGAQ